MERERLFLDYARKCDERASKISDGRLNLLFRDLAEQWRQLAALARDMAEDSKQATEFFKTGQ